MITAFQVPAFLALDRPARADSEAAATGRIGLGDRVGAIDDEPAGREIRAFDEFQHLRVARVGLVDQQDRGVEQFGGIVWRNAGRHADRDPRRTVGQQVREQAGEQFRLMILVIVGRAVIDGIFVETVHHIDRDLGQPRLGVPVGGGIIAVDIAEIALPVDERIAHRETLGEPHHRVIDRLVAVRMVFADHVADNAGALLVALRGIELQQPHRPEQAAMDGFQPVAKIGQRACGDRRQRIDEVPIAERAIERRIDDRVEGVFRVFDVCRHTPA